MDSTDASRVGLLDRSRRPAVPQRVAARVDARSAARRRRCPGRARRAGLAAGEGGDCSEVTAFDERDGGTFFWFADPDGNTWSVQELRARADKPLIHLEHRGRSDT